MQKRRWLSGILGHCRTERFSLEEGSAHNTQKKKAAREAGATLREWGKFSEAKRRGVLMTERVPRG